MTRIASFFIGCAVGVLLLLLGQQLGLVELMRQGAAAVVLLSGVVVMAANTPRSRLGRALARSGVIMFFSWAFFELAHRMSVSSFDPTPLHSIVVLLLSIVIGAIAYATSLSADAPHRRQARS